MYRVLAHVWYKCPPGCERPRCMFCEGGLSSCTVCGAAEGELLTCCPGYRLNQEALEACYTGNVADFVYFRRLRGSDFFFIEVRRWLARLRK